MLVRSIKTTHRALLFSLATHYCHVHLFVEQNGLRTVRWRLIFTKPFKVQTPWGLRCIIFSLGHLMESSCCYCLFTEWKIFFTKWFRPNAAKYLSVRAGWNCSWLRVLFEKSIFEKTVWIRCESVNVRHDYFEVWLLREGQAPTAKDKQHAAPAVYCKIISSTYTSTAQPCETNHLRLIRYIKQTV